MSSRKYQKFGEWKDGSGGSVPHRAVAGGVDESGETLYVARANQDGDYVCGKLVPSHGVCYVAYGGKEHSHSDYQVLCNESDSDMDWISSSDGNVPSGAVQGGADSSGEKLFIGRAWHDGSLTIGKIHKSHGVCYVPFGGEEHRHSDYEALVFNTVLLQN